MIFLELDGGCNDANYGRNRQISTVDEAIVGYLAELKREKGIAKRLRYAIQSAVG